MARAANFDLAKALASRSFTPAQRDAPALVELVVGGEEPATTRAAAALAKLGEVARKAVEARLGGGGPVGGDTAELGDASTARLVGVLGRLARAGDATARSLVIARVGDDHVRVRRAAIGALGKLGGDDVEGVLVARWDASDVPADERRALAEALGKVGGEEAIQRLRATPSGADAELERRRRRGVLMAVRTATRGEESSIDIDYDPADAFDVVLRCKHGLAGLLVEELAQRGITAHPRGDAAAAIPQFCAPWRTLQHSRLWMTAAFESPLGNEPELVDRIVRAMQSRQVKVQLYNMTNGAIRYRLGFSSGHRRALVWKIAHELTADRYINDPTDTTWDVFVDEDRAMLAFSPRKAPDLRFAWRVAEVPAASHPTVAAALAFVAGPRGDDRVWDPFVGSGAELVECGRRGPCGSLIGSDLDQTALAAARANLDAAGVRADLVHGDARTFDPATASLIITNPPLGSRVQLDAAALLVEALPNFARVLAPGGRLVWITPAPKRTSPVAERLGLRRTRSMAVDLGGVRGQLERWDR